MKSILSTICVLALTASLGNAMANTSPSVPSVSSGSCSISDMPGSFACKGSFSKNDKNITLSTLNYFYDEGTFFDSTDFVLKGKSDKGTFFSNNPGTSTGTLTFGTVLYGDFIISLKASDSHSFYAFEGTLSGVTSVTFNTIGTSTNDNGFAQDLSHASIWFGPNGTTFGCGLSGCTPPPIPEPSTYALMLAGLGAIGFISRRRNRSV